MITIAICTEPEDFVKEEHICYYTIGKSTEIMLVEVVQRYYKHPQAPEDAIIPIIETRTIGKFHRGHPEAALSILLEAAQNGASQKYDRNR